jgi:3-isopropylmalate/(R)-2-methylmalate dehydratase large subunit
MGKTLFDKIWEQHVVDTIQDGPDVLYIDRHLIHEVTSPQAFAGLEKRGIPVYRPERVIATADHNVPTKNQHLPIRDLLSRQQVEELTRNCRKHGIELYGLGHPWQGIVHVIGPELGFTLPGQTIVCGDSHTATHGAFGTIAFGIGTSEVEMVMATQCLLQDKPDQMRITVNGKLVPGVVSKDLILYIISRLSASGATGHFVEYSGSVFREMSMEARMTVCNMSIEMGARGGLIAPDQITFDYVRNRKFAPKEDDYLKALEQWKLLFSDDNANFDSEYTFDAADIEPMITYGTNPGLAMKITDPVPDMPEIRQSLEYMGLSSGQSLIGKPVDYVFIGSCTNGRIEDFREVANIIRGKKKAEHVGVYLVPGSKQVEKQIETEGFLKIFEEAGMEVRQPGCSACLGMNEDKVPRGKYCVSTSNRNFEGRQGPGARTFLASPLTAAAAIITGVITDVRTLL